MIIDKIKSFFTYDPFVENTFDKNYKEILSNVKEIELKAQMLVDGFFNGAYHSIFKGRGIEFSDIREYEYADDFRSIDWNVSARLNKPYVKKFVEERDLDLYVLFDLSSSNFFGKDIDKFTYNLYIAISFLFAGVKNNDKISLVGYTDDIDLYMPPRKGKKYALAIIDSLIKNIKFQNKSSNLKNILSKMTKIAKKKSIIVIISDFMEDKDYLSEIKNLTKRNQVFSIISYDKNEYEIPQGMGIIEVEDLETGENKFIDTEDKKFIENYKKEIEKYTNELKNDLRKYGSLVVSISTQDDIYKALKVKR
ncbi:MAG: DUF58 domain-containing protein [Candidatus Nanoarchaeia archaeon]|nr:DUF58 domain-containing protein [Candidatus Nanoarchaeia archaeon]